MNPKITKLREELEKNKGKIAKLTARNKVIEARVKELEDLDIIATVRALHLTPDELKKLLEDEK